MNLKTLFCLSLGYLYPKNKMEKRSLWHHRGWIVFWFVLGLEKPSPVDFIGFFLGFFGFFNLKVVKTFIAMKNNNDVIVGYYHIKMLFKFNNVISLIHDGNTEIFWYYRSINFRLILFSHLDTYFWLGVGLLRWISRYLIFTCSRRKTNCWIPKNFSS